MTEIDRLIEEYCPDGVEYKELKELVLNTKNIKWSENENLNFQYIDLSSVELLTGKILELIIINKENHPSRAQQIVNERDIIFGTTRPLQKRLAIIDKSLNNQICSTGYCILRADINKVNYKWIYYNIQTENFYKYIEKWEQGTSYPSITNELVKAFKIPIPPLPVQNAIVEHLDAFSALQAELQAELTLRKKQYTYYQNKLLTFDENNPLFKFKVEYKKLGEISEITNNGIDKKNNVNDDEIILLNYVDVYNNKYLDNSIPKMIVTATKREKEKCEVKKGDIFITPTSETKEDIGHSAVAKEDLINCYYSYHIMRIRLNEYNYITSKYINYVFESRYVNNQIVKKSRGITRYNLIKSDWENIIIPIPPLHIQERLVYVLDNFDKICGDLNIGLPREIELRQKQYEYYRDKLLTFVENPVNFNIT
ncbi:restriction endonuclease subunit S [Oceanivirga salmonicida]|uniref:restriction endonuclease subunit S n=1 Tax=Oceanivirga salmonicida TaxID=1769291 RepID=UPI00082E83BF|nr:restriction endonuclease subunit S [Oceanivirga salmonicida]